MMDPEKDIFRPGQKYSPKVDFSRLGSHFVKGECLIFKRTVYERYDDVYCHEFFAESSEAPVKTWFLLKGETPADWNNYFSKIDSDVANSPS